MEGLDRIFKNQNLQTNLLLNTRSHSPYEISKSHQAMKEKMDKELTAFMVLMKQFALYNNSSSNRKPSMKTTPTLFLIIISVVHKTYEIVCSGASPFQYQGTCYSSCPAPAPYDYLGICYPNCPWIPPTLTYLEGTSCVTSCTTDYADDSTRQCVPTCPTSPTLTFKDTTRKKCVQMCSTNPSQFANLVSNTCVANCPGSTWGDPDTRTCVDTCPVGTFYQVYALSQLCVSRCYPNYFSDLNKLCVIALSCPSTPVMYYGDDSTNLCVTECPYNTGTYAEDSTQRCVYFCTLGTFADNTTRKCVSTCPFGPPRYFGSNITHRCHLQCNQGEFADSALNQCTNQCTNNTFGDFSTRKCVTVCPQSQKTFADPTAFLCVTLCNPGYYADNDTRSCVASTSCSRNYVGDPLTLTCIAPSTCPVGYFADYSINKICVTRCPTPYWGRTQSRKCELLCQWTPPNLLTYYDSTTRTCVEKCPSNPRSFALKATRGCVNPCPVGYFGSILTYECVQVCPTGYQADNTTFLCVSTCNTNSSITMYMFTPNTSCLTSCPADYYAQNITQSCVTTCPQWTYAYDGNNTCLPWCPNGLYADNYSQECVVTCPAVTEEYADSSTNTCVEVCPVIPDYYGQDLNDGNRSCVPTCTLTSQYADPQTRTCVTYCNVTAGYFGYQTDRRCYLTCPTGYGNPYTTKCTAVCPQIPFELFGDNSTMRCVDRCPNQTYGNAQLQMCVVPADCEVGYFADDTTGRCLPICSVLLNLFGDPVSRKCVSICPFTYFANNITRKCQTDCTSANNYYKDPSTKTCVRVCPTLPDYYADPLQMTCVDTCSGTQYRIAYSTTIQTIRTCVSMCPTSPSFYADEQTKTCVTQCANQTYLFINNTYRGCLKVCPPQVYTGSISVDLYADNTTWMCVSVCPQGYYAFKHPTNTSIRLCVKMCEVVAGTYYFAQNMKRTCVTQCPLALYGTYGDAIDMACVSTCSRQQFRDKVTKLCTYSCSSTYFADNTTWNCVQKCPNGTFAQSINQTCVKYCPKDYYAYTLTNECTQNCSHWRYFANNISWMCVTNCPSDPDYYGDYISKQCVLRCPNNTFAAYNAINTSSPRVCVLQTSCPGSMVADPVNARCRTRCTLDPMYFAMNTTKLCGPVCLNSTFADNTTGLCVAICPSPYFGVNTTVHFTCVQYCPAAEYKLTPGRMCVPVCPSGYFADNLTMSCVSGCPDNYYGILSNNTCTIDCAPMYRDDTTKLCKTSCPVGYTASNNSYLCQSMCDYGEYEYNRVCFTTCSQFGLFADNLTRKCLPGCPDDPFTFADTTNSKCNFNCGGGRFAYAPNRTCLASCPPTYFMETTLFICLQVCLQGQYADINTSSCVVDCLSSNQTFINPFTRQCVQHCPSNPDLYGHLNSTCIAHCPVGWYAENFTRTCMQICPNVSSFFVNQSWADDLTHRCVTRCSALSYAYQNSTHNLCLNVCPIGWFASQFQQACVQVCPNSTFAHNTSHTCVQMCPNGEYGDIHTKICSAQCLFNNSQYRDNSTNMCVTRCPDNPSMFAQHSTMECVLICEANFYGYIINRTCLQNCPDPYFIDTSTQMCVLECPVHEGTFADSQIRKCTPTCTNYTINSTNVMFYADLSTLRCVQVCPDLPQKLYGFNATNQCIQSCPSGSYGDNDTRLCLDKCVFEDPKFTWEDRINNFCVDLCPLDYFADNRTFSCETGCTTSFFADNSTRRCVVTCPVDPASYGYIANKTCIYFCPNGLFADEITRNCVPRCPTTPFTYYHYTPTNKCVKQCLYPYFAEVQTLNCVQRCQDGFYGNLTTKKCQTCKTQCVTCSAYLECLSCTSGFFLYNFECVTQCPAYPVMYFAHLQSSICFLKCPDPYFGQTNTGLCHLSCPVLYYGDLVSRVCTHCPTGCFTCDTGGCYSCLANYTFVNQSLSCSLQCNLTAIYFFGGTCYTSCPDGSYLNLVDLVTCLACNSECATCSLTASNCTKCSTKFWYNYQCVNACPANYFVDSNVACVACSLYPEKCVLEPLTYKIQPFTQNYQLHAYVVFNRPVNMTIDQFQNTVQIKYNGQTVKPSNFTTQFYNRTTYWVTFRNSSSLNENSLSIGFQPGFIVDMYGNQLTVNQVSSNFQAQTGVNQSVADSSTKISLATSIFSWIILALVLLFLIKSGYPFLIAIECVQIFYMFTFIRLNPIPYLQLQFLIALKNVHFLFLPSFFPGPTYIKSEYSTFLSNSSFLYNVSPFIVIIGFAVVVYLLFMMLSSKKILSNKTIRQGAKKIKKYRLKYGIINDAIWFVYLYAIFMAMLQFSQVSVKTTWDIINIVFAAIVFVLLLVYTVFMIYLGNKYKDPSTKLPSKWSFLRSQPSHFPMQIAMRYLRRLFICACLQFTSVQSQCITIICCCFLFLMFILCFTPSDSMVTNYINVAIESSYIILAGLYFGYYKLTEKSLSQQVGFAVAMIAVKAVIILIILGWIIYRGVLMIKQTQTWQNVYHKVTENKDPEYLKQQQRKRDLQFDWGQFENKSEKTDHNILQSSSRGFEIRKQKQNIFDLKEDTHSDDFSPSKQGKTDKKSEYNEIKDSNSSYDGSGSGPRQNDKFRPNRTQKLKKGKSKKQLEVLQKDQTISVIDVEQEKQQPNKMVQTKVTKIQPQVSKQERAIWDDIQFDEHQI